MKKIVSFLFAIICCAVAVVASDCFISAEACGTEFSEDSIEPHCYIFDEENKKLTYTINTGSSDFGAEFEEIAKKAVTVELEEGLTVLPMCCMYCSSMKTLILPSTFTYDHEKSPHLYYYLKAVFHWELSEIIVSDDNPKYCSYEGTLYSKDMTDLIVVPPAKKGAFNIPYGVERICDCAFYDCFFVTSVAIPDSVKIIEEGAFGLCYNVTSVVVPSSVEYIGAGAFCLMRNVESVVLNCNITSLEPTLFYGDEKLTSVNIPDSVTMIGMLAFQGCNSLKEVTIPVGVTYISPADEVMDSDEVGVFTKMYFEYIFNEDGYIVNGTDVEYAPSDITIRGYAGSYAETYAKESNLKFIPIEDPEENPDNGFDFNAFFGRFTDPILRFFDFIRYLFGLILNIFR